jgi:drug/metabolite transporter (DMT)-like permease
MTSDFVLGNVFLLCSLLLGAGSQVLFKAVFNEVGPLRLAGAVNDLLLAGPGRTARLAAAAGLLVAGFVCWVLSLSRLNLSYAYPVACSSALLVALGGVLFLNETVTPRMWGGAALIVLGTVLLAPAR